MFSYEDECITERSPDSSALSPGAGQTGHRVKYGIRRIAHRVAASPPSRLKTGPYRRDYRRAVSPPPDGIVGVWLIGLSLFQRATGSCQYVDIELVTEDRITRSYVRHLYAASASIIEPVRPRGSGSAASRSPQVAVAGATWFRSKRVANGQCRRGTTRLRRLK